MAGGLREQAILIRSLCRNAIQIQELTLVTKEAWPELHRAAEYRVEVFTQAARALQATDVCYRELRKRINQDEEYAYAIGVWVSFSSHISFRADAIEYAQQIADRLLLARGPARAHALNEVAVFQLGIGLECIARVKAVFEHKTDVYPGQWGTNAKGEVSFRKLSISYSDNNDVACLGGEWERNVSKCGHYLCLTFRILWQLHGHGAQIQGTLH